METSSSEVRVGIQASASSSLSSGEMMIEDLAVENRREKLLLRWAAAAAILFHGVLLSITFPRFGTTLEGHQREQKIFVLEQTRFRPPPPPKGAPQPPEPKKKRIPIPDPTPEDPEPIVDPEVQVPELPNLDDVVFGIPDAPPAVPGAGYGYGEGPFRVGGAIRPPEKVYFPQPLYTEEARMARIQGIVILQAVIDPMGNVTQLEPLKELPLGLTESAIETVSTWKFEPATRNGEPVAVFFHLSVRFSLQ